jgi:flagellar biosynthetic protein FliQ
MRVQDRPHQQILRLAKKGKLKDLRPPRKDGKEPLLGVPMNEAEVIEICREAIIVMLKVVGPILLAGLVIGVTVSLIQAVTQIQEMTLSFIPKMLVIFAMTIWLLPFMMSTLGGFAQSMSDRIVQVGMSND